MNDFSVKMNVPRPGAHSSPRLLPLRQPWRWVTAGIVLVTLGALVSSLATNQNMRWDIVWEYLFADIILKGVANTLILTVLCMVIAVVLGVVIALMNMSNNFILKSVGNLYIWFFRGVPLLVQLVFWFNLALLWPQIGVVINGYGITISTNQLISSFTAAVLGLALHEVAYMAEIVRGGILTVGKGQTEAARALGMPEKLVFQRIILPQAMRAIIPPTGNELISLLKATSLVAFIAGGDLMTVVQNIYSMNFLVIPLLVVATLWYLLITSIATIGQNYIEKYYSQGFQGEQKMRRRGGLVKVNSHHSEVEGGTA